MAPRRGQHGERIGLPAHEIARALDRIDGNVGLEGRAWAAEPLAAVRLRRLPARGLADRHHGVDVDIGHGGLHGIERGAASVLTVAPADPAEGGSGGAFGDAAERKDELWMRRTGRHGNTPKRPRLSRSAGQRATDYNLWFG
jgi:hypothetical protein